MGINLILPCFGLQSGCWAEGEEERRENTGDRRLLQLSMSMVMGVARSREDAVEVVTHGQRQIGFCCNRLYVDGDVTDLMH